MPRKATDGVSKNPAHATTALAQFIDWARLKREFLLNETHPRPRLWLHEVQRWPIKKCVSGNTKDKTKGWSAERALLQDRITNAKIEEALRLEQQLVPDLRSAKRALIASIMGDITRWYSLQSADKKLIYQVLKVELGEATDVRPKETMDARDTVEALLEEDGLMKDGVIIDDDPSEDAKLVSAGEETDSGANSSQATTEDSQTPTQVPQT